MLMDVSEVGAVTVLWSAARAGSSEASHALTEEPRVTPEPWRSVVRSVPEPRVAQSLCTFCNKWLCFQCTDLHQHDRASAQASESRLHQTASSPPVPSEAGKMLFHFSLVIPFHPSFFRLWCSEALSFRGPYLPPRHIPPVSFYPLSLFSLCGAQRDE
ncbi:hypothetical protein AOLI_G00330830 [Acnodon oligacanthus]